MIGEDDADVGVGCEQVECGFGGFGVVDLGMEGAEGSDHMEAGGVAIFDDEDCAGAILDDAAEDVEDLANAFGFFEDVSDGVFLERIGFGAPIGVGAPNDEGDFGAGEELEGFSAGGIFGYKTSNRGDNGVGALREEGVGGLDRFEQDGFEAELRGDGFSKQRGQNGAGF